jgi:chemotaxis protein methyltransferase CheR
MNPPAITAGEFGKFQRFIYEVAGISMADGKQALVSGRLARRLAHHKCRSFGDYFALLAAGESQDEVQVAVDLLTTNETYFFREEKHFDLLARLGREAASAGRQLRAWSAASSSGEEAYSMAMVLADSMGVLPWDVFGSDISARMLRRAQRGQYPMTRSELLPKDYLKRFCLKGQGTEEGTMLIDRSLRARVNFAQINLNRPLPQTGQFDVIFLRNVLIYFKPETKRDVVERVLQRLKPGGIFCIGHSESLNDISDAVVQLAPSIYRKP